MDIANPQLKLRRRRRRWWLTAGALAATLLAALALARLGPALPEAERGSLWIDTVQRGPMLREVRATGVLVPREFRWLAAGTAAQVEHILVWPGAQVQPDTVLMELSNPSVEDALRNAQAQVTAAEADVQAKRAELQSQWLDQKVQLAQAQSEYAAAGVKAVADGKADARHLIPHVLYEQGQIALGQLKYRVEINQQRVAAFEASMHAQQSAVDARLQQQRSNLELRQRQIDNLKVRAGVAGVLQEVAVQEGAQVAEGASLARVAKPERLLARLRVPEVQAKDVAIGMPVNVDTHNGVVDGRVERIDPAVRDGSVQVDVGLRGALPSGARPDLSVDGRILLARLDDALSVGRPVQAQGDGAVSLFRLDPASGVAVRVPVQVGVASVDRIQVLRGLAQGDQVILSDTSAWDKYARIRVR
ncbi:HlyD family efflux transporter periplasmic adaptor subunit [Dyella sp. RRB7]|uniref:efflux RND transporter periplasmic adaptor subunit n=1 Tax=Dyella sp. RRB7 TaxID=2919502 RepID=UPI001FAAFE69|nr:HlyD family efflux transporter periplasmic adaptor subunit [Dyella sp. RRB7]